MKARSSSSSPPPTPPRRASSSSTRGASATAPCASSPLYTGDPTAVGSGFSDGEVSLIGRAEHPLTAALTTGVRVPILADNFEHASFSGYSGRTLADLFVGQLGVAGGGIGLAPPHARQRPRAAPRARREPVDRADRRVAAGGVTRAARTPSPTPSTPSSPGVTGTVTDAAGEAPLAAAVTVAETGETVEHRRRRHLHDAARAGHMDAARRAHRLHAGGARRHRRRARRDHRRRRRSPRSGLGAIGGTVTGGGAPLAGATVEIPAHRAGRDDGRRRRYAINDVPGGTYDVRSAPPGTCPVRSPASWSPTARSRRSTPTCRRSCGSP